ncbi:voltage-gated potassium channel subunit beta-2 isoform X3 [Aphis craccivora]|uniref:Voltage-gated potassium channel subunit beta-2 isoform X3 n=1 Tax=Aphis craccivora TaxID=307492 RepID=A0A6G0YPL0_APHCR|nr:voltage-gated potassium channel subunit beta-2 isoform X3 [Aphis craccivora]
MYTTCKQLNCSTPILQQFEYHILCREKAEIYMPELYNKIVMRLLPSVKNSLRVRSSSRTKAFYSISWIQDDRKPPSKEHIVLTLGCSLVQLYKAWTLKNESVQCLLLGVETHQFYHVLHGLQLLPKLNINVMAKLEHLERILDNKPVQSQIVSTLAMR